MIIKYNNYLTIKRISQYSSFMVLLSGNSKICCLSIPLIIAKKYKIDHEITIYRNFENIENRYYENIYIRYGNIYMSYMNYYYDIQDIMMNKEKYIDFYYSTIKTKSLMIKLYDN